MPDRLTLPVNVRLFGRNFQFEFTPLWWWNADSRAAEAFSAMLAWYWGVLLLLPVDTFSLSRSYRAMAEIAPEWAWGLMYCFVGLVQSAALCGGVRFFRGPGAALAFLFWTAAAAMFFFSNPFTHAVGIYSMLALMNAWVITRGPVNDGR